MLGEASGGTVELRGTYLSGRQMALSCVHEPGLGEKRVSTPILPLTPGSSEEREGKDQASFQVCPAPLFHIFSSLIPSPVVASNPALVFSAYGAKPRPHSPPHPTSLWSGSEFAYESKPSLGKTASRRRADKQRQTFPGGRNQGA